MTLRVPSSGRSTVVKVPTVHLHVHAWQQPVAAPQHLHALAARLICCEWLLRVESSLWLVCRWAGCRY
jgi:hypothetical protein